MKLFIGLLLCSLNLHAKLDLMLDEPQPIAQPAPMSQTPQPPLLPSQQPMPIEPQKVLSTPATQQAMPAIPETQQPLPLPKPPEEIVFVQPQPRAEKSVITPILVQETSLPNIAAPEATIETPSPNIAVPEATIETVAGELPTEFANISPLPEPIAKVVPAGKSKSKKASSKKTKQKAEPLIAFDFKDEPLANIINEYAAHKSINIILPQGGDAIKTTISFAQKQKISLSQAERYLSLFLEMAGYNMYPTDGFSVISKKTDNTEGREPVNLYVNIPPAELPQSSQTIRAIYYLTNFQVPATEQGNEPIRTILVEMLGQKKFKFDQKSNAIILSGSADKIASAMTIILELDAAGSPEVVEVFPLFYTNADMVSKLIQGQISAVVPPTQSGAKPKTAETGNYFAPNTRAIADQRTNSIILIGTEAAVSRIKSFTREFIDVPAETGKSILHIYDLQYLDAVPFAKVLSNIVKPTGASGQSEKDGGGGAQRFFEGVIVTAQEEKPDDSVRDVGTNAAASLVKGAAGKVSLGGNRIIVTAKQDDWIIVKDIIEQLDKPELQVIIEVMILDITLEGQKELEMQTRDPLSIDFHSQAGSQFQSAQVVPPILDPNNTNPTTLAGDLLRLLVPGGNSVATSLSSDRDAGSTIISFKDPCDDKIWGLLRILDKWITTKIISHPFLVTKNNVKAKERLSTIRQGSGREVSSGGNATIKIEDFTATVAVEVTPRISSLDRLNLQIRVDINNFVTSNITGAAIDFTRTTRAVETNATLSTGQVLILGGLTQEVDQESESKIPILGDIPILGYLFKSTLKSKTKNNLAIFIHPTIVEPKLRAGQNRYTNDRIENEKKRLESESLFSKQRDPVVRMFFNNMGKTSVETLDGYLHDAHYGEKHDEGKYKPAELTTEEAKLILPAERKA